MSDPLKELEARLRADWHSLRQIEPPTALIDEVRRLSRLTRQDAPRRSVRRGLVAAAAVIVFALLAAGAFLNSVSVGPGRLPRVTTSTASPSPVLPSPVTMLHGQWRQMAKPAMGGRSDDAMVWTGSESIVWGGTESTSDRLVFDHLQPPYGAAYDPVTDTWQTIPDAPIAGRDRPVAAWSGHELILWGGLRTKPNGELEALADGAAYDPATRAWRKLPDAPIAGSDAVGGWLSGRLVVVTSEGAARYDPGVDRWEPLNVAPIRPGWRTAAVASGRLVVIAFGDGATGTVDGASLDPTTWSWTKITVPLTVLDAGVELVGAGDLAVVPATGIAFDPIATSWRVITSCPGAAGGASWTGRYILGVVAAYDFRTGSCLTLPPSPPRAAPFNDSNGRGGVGVWTGAEYFTWSGGTGGDIAWVPNDGAVFRPSVDLGPGSPTSP